MVEITKMSSKGQVVIPREIRDILKVEEGSIFAVIGNKDSIVLKKIETPSKNDLIKELEKIAIEGRKRAEKLGIKESHVHNIIERVRKSRK